MPTSRERTAWLAAPWLAIVAGGVLLGRTVLVPFWQDDLFQRAMVVGGFPAARGPFQLYDFVRAGERARFVAIGVLPWWTDETYRIRFFRPLASAILYVEHRFIGSAVVMHALSLAWWGAAVLSVAWLYRGTLSLRAAGVATLVFALAPCHVPALALVAQREVLLAVVFGALALGVMARAGREASRSRYALATVLASLSVASGEYGLCLLGYALLVAIVAKRSRLALPFALPAAAYLVVRAALGYGVAGAGFYRDPVTAPLRFLAHGPRSLFELVADAWSTFDRGGASWAWLIACGVVVLALLVRARECPSWLRWGSVLALVPTMGAASGQRLVAPALLGVAAVVGVLVDRAISEPRRFVGAALALGLAALHLVHAPFATFQEAKRELANGRAQAEHAAFLAAHASTSRVGVIGLASWDTAYFTGVVPGAATPSRLAWRVLVNARHALLLRRDARTLDVIVPNGQGFFPAGTDDIFRPEDHPLHEGDVRDVPGMHVEVISAGGDHGPPRIRFTFARDLEDASFVWLTQKRSGYVSIAPPRTGYGLSLAP